ncbi:1613_t:CDS:1 [Acaulospora colombiana]|uniref:1613_t:CDS:1 n=1 Tax=Acaulospora colombiana TaxID=27376 RepID=A0ACA9K777_9GLOM|nr:1613_t:CDS:1 [Acaulospora colombiana]
MLQVATLPYLCIIEIAENFHNNRQSLRSCLLINRHWCRNIVPILWRDPFRSIPLVSSIHLINSYLQCCSNKELDEILSGSSDFIRSSNVPCFDYPQYLRTLNVSRIGAAVRHWLKFSSKTLLNQREIPAWEEKQKSFCRFFTNRSSAIDHVIVDMTLRSPRNEASISEIFSYPGAKLSISHLREVECYGMFEKTELLQLLSKTSKGIRKLSVSIIRTEGELSALVALIHAQIRLCDVTLADCFDTAEMVVKALTSCKSSLRHIRLLGGVFDCQDLRSLLECDQMETLMIADCAISTSLKCSSGDTRKIPELKKLREITIQDTFVPRGLLVLYLQAANSSIREVSLSELITADTNEIIHAIASYCPNLRVFKLSIDHGQFNILYRLLESCKKLKNISIDSIAEDQKGWLEIDRESEVDANEILPSLGKHIPSSLRILRIWSNWVFTPESLEQFFINSVAKIKILDLSYCECINDQHLEILLKYAKVGTLKGLYVDRARHLSAEAVDYAGQFIDIC